MDDILLKYFEEKGMESEIKTSELKALGFSDYKIKRISSDENSVLVRSRRGYYKLNPLRIRYGEKIEKFKNLLLENKYKEAALLIKEEDLTYFTDYDYLLLFLLSYRTLLPSYLKSVTRNLKINEHLSRLDLSMSDEVKDYIAKGKFGLAYFRYRLVKREKGENLSLEEKLLFHSLNNLSYYLQRRKRSYIKLIKQNKYEQVLRMLNENLIQCVLDEFESCLKRLLEVLINIKETKEIPEIMEPINKNFVGYINSNDFESALKCSRFEIDTILLIEIINEINLIKQSNYSKDEELNIDDILKSLINKDYKCSFLLISHYLRKINKYEYLKLIIELVSVSYIEDDIAFITPMRALLNLKKGNILINPVIYLDRFYDAVNHLSLNDAEIYLRVLTEFKKLGIVDIDLDSLVNCLEKAKSSSFDPLNRIHLALISDLLNDGLTLEEACDKYNLDQNKRNVVYLMFAREYYYMGDYLNGDKLLKYVEKQKNKSTAVKKLFLEIIRDKKLYVHRSYEIGQTLTLKKSIL